MNFCKKLFIVAIAVLATACSPVGIHLQPTDNLRMTVLGGAAASNSWVLLPEHAAHRQLVAWLDANQYGWSTYLVSAPAAGLLADADSGWRLQFVEYVVLLCPRQQACRYKKFFLKTTPSCCAAGRPARPIDDGGWPLTP